MKRRTRLPAENRKRQILEGALRVFGRKGFDRATSRELAEAAGVSEALIFKYFPTKEALYSELPTLLAGNKDRLLERWTRQQPGTEALVQTLYGMARMVLLGPSGQAKDDSFDRLIGQSLLGDGKFAAAFFEEFFHPVVPFLARCLEEAHKAGDLDVAEAPEEMACVLFHHTVGAGALFLLSPQPMFPTDDPELILRNVLAFALRGLGLSEPALTHHLEFERLGHSFENAFKPGDQL